MTKVFRGLPIMACTCREIQRERAHSIAITSNFQATSKRIRRDFHKSSRVSSCASESSESLEKSIHKINLGRGSRAPKIESKLTPEPSEDTPWHPRAFQERLRRVLGRPRRAPGASRVSAKTSRGARKSAQKHSGACRGNQNRRQVAPGSEKIMLSSPVSCAKLHRRDFSSIFACF